MAEALLTRTGGCHCGAVRFEVDLPAVIEVHACNCSMCDKHLFCRTCGVKSFYRPRSNPDGWSVNARCLDDRAALDLRIEAFDGQNWEAHAAGLAHLSEDPA